MASMGYSAKALQRMLGKVACADRPSMEAKIHATGPVAWMVWGPQNAGHTPPKVLTSLGKAIAHTITPCMAKLPNSRGSIPMVHGHGALWATPLRRPVGPGGGGPSMATTAHHDQPAAGRTTSGRDDNENGGTGGPGAVAHRGGQPGYHMGQGLTAWASGVPQENPTYTALESDDGGPVLGPVQMEPCRPHLTYL